jgi:phosphate/sulfate permease
MDHKEHWRGGQRTWHGPPVLLTQTVVAGLLIATAALLFTVRESIAGVLVASVAVMPLAATFESAMLSLRLRRFLSRRSAPRREVITVSRNMPAGTQGQPPLPLQQLDDRAWKVLSWRQDRLPHDLVRTEKDWRALWRLEARIVWGIADRLGLNDDQRFSLIAHHYQRLRTRVRDANPNVVKDVHGPHDSPREAIPLTGKRRHLVFSWLMPRMMTGLPMWFVGRWLALQSRSQAVVFQLKARRAYRDQPGLDS